jgi:ribA/ribD-fused uncharacterized protein
MPRAGRSGRGDPDDMAIDHDQSTKEASNTTTPVKQDSTTASSPAYSPIQAAMTMVAAMKAAKSKSTPANDIKQILDIVSQLITKVDGISDRLDKIEPLPAEVRELKLEIAKAQSDISEVQSQASYSAMKVQSLEKDLSSINNHNRRLENELGVCKDKLLRMEAHSRRDNLLIEGVKDKDKENYADTEMKVHRIFKDILKCEDFESKNIVRAHRLGQYNDHSKRPRVIIVKFHHYKTREDIWSKRTMLKDSGLWLKEDYPREMVERRQVLLPIYKEAKRLKMNAKFNVDKLFVDGKEITLDNLQTLPIELSQETINSPIINEEVQAFFREPSPFSNFHTANFELNGLKYKNSEQYLFHMKADLANDKTSMTAIMSAKSPQDVKRIGEKIVINPVDWRAECKNIMYKGCKAKFSQNPRLAQYLLDTQERVLVEASKKDKYWGSGLSLGDFKRQPATTEWPGENNLGKILVKIRQELRDGR